MRTSRCGRRLYRKPRWRIKLFIQAYRTNQELHFSKSCLIQQQLLFPAGRKGRNSLGGFHYRAIQFRQKDRTTDHTSLNTEISQAEFSINQRPLPRL